jgi:selenocysteine-specific elongation factor
MTKHFILATAGHVEHGKSSLVKALTGTDPDRLPEEKARGITIDLGFAHLQLPRSTPEAAELDLGIVDVPGHEDFVRNMVAGAGSVDLALFVVAADDGWMPQTEEHLQILSYLGVTRAVVALTKIDLAPREEDTVVEDVREQLSGSPFADAPIVPVSVVSGRGLGELKDALSCALARAPEPRDIGKPRLWVDRVFSLRGIGTVVTGTLMDGVFKRGQSVMVHPSAELTQIRSLQSHLRELESVGPGMRTALSLADMEVATRGGHISAARSVGRGTVVTVAGKGTSATACDVLLTRSARLTNHSSAAARPLRDGSRIRLHIGTADIPGYVHLAGRKQLLAGEECVAQVRLDFQLFAFTGDTFVIRDWAEQDTLGGGMVLDSDPRRRAFRDPEHQGLLLKQAHAPTETAPALEARLGCEGAAPTGSLLVNSRFSAAELAEGLSRLQAANKVVQAGGWAVTSSLWNTLRRLATDAIDAHHRAHPEQTGLPLIQLRAALAGHLPSSELFEVLVAELGGTGFIRSGTTIQRTSHQRVLPSAFQQVWVRLRASMAAKPFDPPSRKELVKDRTASEVLKFQITAGEVVELGEDVAMLAEEFARATEVVKGFLNRQGSATVSELRQALGSSRRVVVPLLEKLDAARITRREGDRRFMVRER